MSDIIQFYAKGIPKGQPRPRAFAINGRARVFDPGTAEGWKQQVALAAEPYRSALPLSGAIGVKVVFNMPRPKSHYRTGKNAGELKQDAPWFYAQKPDVDNLAKAVFDALTTIRLWNDDCQIVSADIQKAWAFTGQEGAAIEIFELEAGKVAPTAKAKPQHDWEGLKSELRQIDVKPGDPSLYISEHNKVKWVTKGDELLHKASPMEEKMYERA